MARRERSAQTALRDALAFYFGGRYSRAQKAARRALAIRREAPQLRARPAIHRARPCARGRQRAPPAGPRRARRLLRDAFELARCKPPADPAEEGARLLAAEWALDDRDAERALQLLAELPLGVARRTHALRLKLQAARLARQPQEALKTARLLAKHQAFSKSAAEGLLRSLAFESLDSARDADQLRRHWQQFETTDRRDPFVARARRTRAADLGAVEEARGWLRPFWDRLSEMPAKSAP